jgi:hypothetical protein
MRQTRERELIKRITEQYGRVIDLERAPGVMIEILREFGPNILHTLGEDGEGGGGTGGVSPAPSSIAIAGPGSGHVTLEDIMTLVLDLRKEVIKISEKIGIGR